MGELEGLRPPGGASSGSQPEAGCVYPAGWAMVTAASAGAIPFVVDIMDCFALALSLGGTPWTVVEVRFDPELKRLDIKVDFPPGSCFQQPKSGQNCAVYESEPRSRRHMDFFQFECYVNAHVPRVDGGPDPASGGWRCRGPGTTAASRCSWPAAA